MMTEAQRVAVVSLSVAQAAVVWADLCRAHPEFPPLPTPLDQVSELKELPVGARLMTVITEHDLDVADLILPMLRRTHQDAVEAIEAIAGRRITRCVPRTSRRSSDAAGARKARQSLTSGRPDAARRLAAVIKNPKKPGTASYDRFAHYKVGDTLEDCVKRGVTWADVKWDMDRGFITLVEEAGAAVSGTETTQDPQPVLG